VRRARAEPIIFFPMMALLEPGAEVIYPNPGFPIYESLINFNGDNQCSNVGQNRPMIVPH